jgi:hypothetical protein
MTPLFAAPTEIQRLAIRAALADRRDLVGIAETGDPLHPPRDISNVFCESS